MDYDEKFYDFYTTVCKSISTPVRIKIIELIGREGKLNVSQIQKILDIPITRLSNNLSILYKTGILDKEKKGSFIYYSLKHSEIIDAIKNMKKVVELIAIEGMNLVRKKEMDSENFYHIFASLFDYPRKELKTVFLKFKKLLGSTDEIELPQTEETELSYTSLFINNYPTVPAPPYASSYLSNSDIFNTVEKYYKLGGYYIDNRSQPPDYLIFELIFLSNLYNDNNILLEQKFLEEHFILWFNKFATGIKDNDKIGFYSFIAEKILYFLKNRLKELKYGKENLPS